MMIPKFLKFRDRKETTPSLTTIVTSKDSRESIKSDSTLVPSSNEFQDSHLNLKEYDELVTNSLLEKSIDKLSMLNLVNSVEREKLISFEKEIESLRHIDSEVDIVNNEQAHSSSSTLVAITATTKTKEDELYFKLSLIQRDIMPKWTDINASEQTSVKKILSRWSDIISSNFNRIKSKNKFLKPIEINEQKYCSKGVFDFVQNKSLMKKLLLDLFQANGAKMDSSPQKIKQNTRLILRAFKKFEDTFTCLQSASTADEKLYWFHLNKFLQHCSKALLRCSLYIYENANLYKCSLGSPPLYVIESDYSDDRDVPYVKFETLYEYVYLCLLQLDTGNKTERRKNGHDVVEADVDSDHIERCVNSEKLSDVNKRKVINKNYSLMVNCLIRLIQLATLVRENLTIKERFYSIDTFAHILEHECKLLREYLKEILKINLQ